MKFLSNSIHTAELEVQHLLAVLLRQLRMFLITLRNMLQSYQSLAKNPLIYNSVKIRMIHLACGEPRKTVTDKAILKSQATV